MGYPMTEQGGRSMRGWRARQEQNVAHQSTQEYIQMFVREQSPEQKAARLREDVAYFERRIEEARKQLEELDAGSL